MSSEPDWLFLETYVSEKLENDPFFYTYTKKRIFINIFWVVEIRLYCWGRALCLPFSGHLRSLDFVLSLFCSSSTHFHWQSHPFWWSKLLSYTWVSKLFLLPQPMLSLYIYISTYWTSPPECNRSSLMSICHMSKIKPVSPCVSLWIPRSVIGIVIYPVI